MATLFTSRHLIIDANTVTLNGQIVMTNTNTTTSQYTSSFSFPARGRLNINSNITGNYSNKLILNNVNPIKMPLASDQGIDFNNGGVSTTSIVDYNSSVNGQAVYTASNYIGSAGDNYLNLTLSGAGKKVFNGNTVSVAGNLVTGGGAVDMTTNNPAVTVAGSWTNQTTITAGTGAVLISGNLVNNGGAVLTGNTTAASITVNGTVTNSGTIKANAENITIKGAAANNSVITGGTGALTFSNTYNNNTGASTTTGSGTTTFTGAYVNTAGSMLMTTGSVIFQGDYTANAGATFTAGTGTAYFSGSGQKLADNSTTGTTFNKVTVNGIGTTTITPGAGNFKVAPTGLLTVVSPAKLIAGSVTQGGASYLTLKSAAAGTASVAPITGTAAITGNVTAERYLTGGAGYRSYRLLSSPVNTATVSGNNVYSLNYLQNSMYLTGRAGGGFDKPGNPTVFLYREDLAPLTNTFSGGNFAGISAINNTPSYNYNVDGGGAVYNVTSGSGYMCFFRGDRAATTVAAETTLGYVPATVTLSATGTLNQGAVTVHPWYKPATATLGYTAGSSPVKGYNLVGNPYASSIDLSKFSTTNPAAGIYGPNVSPAIYNFDPVTKTYGTYNFVSKVVTGNGGSIIASGQGFYVQALNSSATLTFNEAAKTTTQVTGSNLLLALRQTNQNQIDDVYGSYLRLKLETDTVNYSDMVIGFNPNSNMRYNPEEDSKYLPGLGGSKQGIAAISSDSVKTAAKWLAYPNSQGQVIKLSVNVSASGTYTIKRTDFKEIPSLYDIWLMDKYKKDSLDITHNTNYTFDVNLANTDTWGDNRFTVVIRQDPASGLHLLSFTAAKAGTSAQVNWKVENEENFTNFEVERSTDNKTFNALGGYLSSSQGTYSYTDSQPVMPADEYRLKLTNVNGNITYSQVVALSYGNQATQIAAGNISIYPNPSKGMINLAITGGVQPAVSSQQLQGTPATTANSQGQVYGIKIVSITGAVLKQTTSASPNWQADVSAYMPGTYVIQVVNNNSNTVVGKGTFVKL